MQISGKVTYVDLSGGFWGIAGANGQNYQPVNGIPAKYRKEGTKVTASVKEVPGVSIFMWGQQVKIESIQGK